jgi:hypothetical protein
MEVRRGEGGRQGALELRAVLGPVQLQVAFPAERLDEVGQPVDPGASDIVVPWGLPAISADVEQMKAPPLQDAALRGPRGEVCPALQAVVAPVPHPKEGLRDAKEHPVLEPSVPAPHLTLPPKEQT